MDIDLDDMMDFTGGDDAAEEQQIDSKKGNTQSDIKLKSSQHVAKPDDEIQRFIDMGHKRESYD